VKKAGQLLCPPWQGGRRAFRGRGLNCFVQGLNLSVDCLQDTSEILPNLDISKSEELNSRGFNELLSGPVFLLLTKLKMTVAVDFNGESKCWAVEVK
jgi:hypothetical protein